MRVLSTSFLVAAMVSAGSAAAQAIATSPETLPACSVGMAAHAQGAGVTLWTTSLEDQASKVQQPDSGVHVVVSAREPKQTIRELTLRVTFLPPGLRVLPTDTIAPTSDRSETTRTFHLTARDGAALKLTGNLLLGRVAGITRVAVQRIEFADGTAWNAPTANPCSITPSGLLLVNANAH
jgi:hypothetical protein